MTPLIDCISSAGPSRRARRIHFSSGEERVTAAAVVRTLGWSEGTCVEASVESAIAECERSCARERALQLVGYRERTRAELRAKLTEDGYPASLADELVTRFAELQLVDDARFAASFVRSKTLSGLGPLRIRRELGTKGLAPDVVETAMEGCEDSSIHEAVRRLSRGVNPVDRRGRERLLRQLTRKGFGLREALDAIDGAGSDDVTCD